MKRRVQNIGKSGTARKASQLLQASDIARKVAATPNAANDPAPIVGQLEGIPVAKSARKAPMRRETPEQRWRRFIEEWKASNHPKPNRMLTVNFDKAALDEHIAGGGTISSFKTEFLDHIRRIYRRTGHPWLAVWAIEVRNTPHIHIVMWIPEDSDFEAQLWRWLRRRFPVPTLYGTGNAARLPDDNSGSPVHMSIIDDTQTYSKTGRSGLDGLCDYLAKAIESNSRRRKGRPIGRIVGRTNDLSNP